MKIVGQRDLHNTVDKAERTCLVTIEYIYLPYNNVVGISPLSTRKITIGYYLFLFHFSPWVSLQQPVQEVPSDDLICTGCYYTG